MRMCTNGTELLIELKGSKMKKSSLGFTLAEVLITLAIIGVVAAMTIPTLVNKYQDRVNETRYKKAVSMLSQAVQLSMAQADSPGNMTHTDLWACKDKDDALECFSQETKKLFKNVALDDEGTYDKMSSTDYGETTNPWEDAYYTFIIGDGMALGYLPDENGLRVIVDTNASSKPNNVSKDLYALSIGANGKVADVTATLAGGNNLPLVIDECLFQYNSTSPGSQLSSCSEAQCESLPNFGDNECGSPIWWNGGCMRRPCY